MRTSASVRPSRRLGISLRQPIGQGVGNVRVERAAQQPRSQAADAEAGRLFTGEQQQLQAAARSETGLLERTHCLQAAQHADRTVVHARVRDGIGMRACAHRGEVRLRPSPAHERVPDRIFADAEAGSLRERLEPRTRLEIASREDDARYGLRGFG